MKRQTEAGNAQEAIGGGGGGGGGGDVLKWELHKTQRRAEREPEEEFCFPRLTCLVTQANEQQLDSSQLTLAIRLRPREMKRGGARK